MNSGVLPQPGLLPRTPILAGAAPGPSSGFRIAWKASGLVAALRRPKKSDRCLRLRQVAAAGICKRPHHEKLRVLVLVSKSTLQYEHGVSLQSEYVVPESVKAAGFQICADELASIVETRDNEKLSMHGQLDGIAGKLVTSLTDGISTDEYILNLRRDIYGVNKFTEGEHVLLYLLLLALPPKDGQKVLMMALEFLQVSILVVSVTATSNYQQSLQFRDLDKEKRKIYVQVTRNGSRQRMLIDDLVPGDVVHLAVGDQVPADGLFISGYSVYINESSLTGESEPVAINEDNPFLLSGTKILDGSCKMLITAVGMKTRWGKLMAVITESGDVETPLQIKLNGVANTIGKIGLFFALLTFFVLLQGLVGQKYHDGLLLSWSGDDVLEILEHFAIAVTIIVVAVPEGLPLAVTLSLAFAMKKMMNEKALVRQLAACETMGSATVICSDKTGTLTTNCMSVVKACVCGNIMEVDSRSMPYNFSSKLPGVALEILLESIFSNTAGDVVLARSSPIDKNTLVKHLRTTFNEVVAVTGDGTNDAPALREADVGLAMGIAGTNEVAKENADVVVLDDNFSTIVTVVKWGCSVYVNIQKFVQFQLTVNIVALLVNFSFACFTGALALATEPPDDNLMKKAPVGRTGKFITNIMWRNIVGQSLFQFVVIW
ncbi:hypothetical protein PR202_gb11778 [Eleusine coracana subsp. coracana]|uniref:Calcium-transporting ATPase n=1 Tax=Eleusine coracana subsp. coracana TaxID=191504 RepID=A0AAV5EN28_ELECO|nr:hypothetical protein PR202_gb11778 [Eleusine coracana subsp. coracana]